MVNICGCFIVTLALLATISNAFVVARNKMTLDVLFSANKDAQREEQFRIQQEMLSRRKNKGEMKKYFEKVEENRKEAQAKASTSFQWQKSQDGDVLEKWKAARSRGEIKPLGYEAEPSKSQSKLGLNVIIPVNPMGMPKYDNGERFDLRLPYAERGYEDPDADVMGKMWSSLKNAFSSKKKET